MSPMFTGGGGDDDESDPAAGTSDDRLDREHLGQWSGGRYPARDKAARLRADAALCAYFRQQKYQGPDWEYFVHELLSYGLSRTRLLLGARALFWKRPGVQHPGVGRASCDLDELVSSVVLAGFGLFFRRGLVEQGWSATGGASLATYFEGACKLVLREKYREWMRGHRRHAREDPCEQMDLFLSDASHSDDWVHELLDCLSDVLTEDEIQMFILISEDYSYAEVGARFGASDRAIEGRVDRARRKAEPFRPKGWRTP